MKPANSKHDLDIKTHWKMKAGRAKIGIFQKMRIKNLRGGQWDPIKKLDPFTLETSKNNLIHNFLREGRVRVKISRFNQLNRLFDNYDVEKVIIKNKSEIAYTGSPLNH